MINELVPKAARNRIIIQEIAITMGSEDIVVKIETVQKENRLDSWIINEFQKYLLKECRDPNTNENYVKGTKTLRVMRDI